MAAVKHVGVGGAVRNRLLACVAVLVIGGFQAGCQTCPAGKRWGKPYAPTWQRVGTAAKNAVLSPYTLVPLAGAGVFALNEQWDRDVSNWARKETPIFGSRTGASKGGKITRNIAWAGALASATATPSGPYPYWGTNKLTGIAVQTAANAATQGIVLQMKKATDRVRPNGKDDLSFPSTITSDAASWAAAGRRNVRELAIPVGYRTAMEATLQTSAALTGWSRVENGSHYPSDVLVGYAIGNAIGVFAHDLFLGPSWRDLRFGVSPSQNSSVNFNVGLTGKL